MEAKWLAIMAVGMFVAMFMAVGVESYSRQQCRVTAQTLGVSVMDAVKLCKR